MDQQGKEGRSLQSWLASFPAERTRDFPVMEVGFLWQGAFVQSGSSFQGTTTAVPFSPEHSQTVHHGGARQSVGKDTQSSTVPGRSWARLRALLQSADKMVTLLELVKGLGGTLPLTKLHT